MFVSFLELYNEDLVDLLNHQKKRTGHEVQIREDVHGQIYWSGVREEACANPNELLQYLSKGSLCRTTGSTDMNSVSSRSHAIFSVILKQQVSEEDQLRTIVSKFHFVDLAGSERVKSSLFRLLLLFYLTFFLLYSLNVQMHKVIVHAKVYPLILVYLH